VVNNDGWRHKKNNDVGVVVRSDPSSQGVPPWVWNSPTESFLIGNDFWSRFMPVLFISDVPVSSLFERCVARKTREI
jgi:hypothetical protein